MKFDAIVGNPPYQENDGGGTGSSAMALYDKFFDVAINLRPQIITLIIKSNWMTGGKGLSAFRKEVLEDRRFKYLYDYASAKDCFNGPEIEFGVCYFLWDSKYNDKCTVVYNMSDNSSYTKNRYLDDYNNKLYIRHEKGLEIVKKIENVQENNFSNIVCSRNFYNTSNIKSTDLSQDDKYRNHISLFYLKKRKRIKAYIKNDTDYKNNDLVNKYKIFLSKANGAAGFVGSPIPAKVIGIPEKGNKNEICSETFLNIGEFNNVNERDNCITYMNTKFFRFLVGLIKQKNMSKETFSLVPLQDFTDKSDIDWTKSISKIDQQLYKKYNLSNEEINFIESMIKPME